MRTITVINQKGGVGKTTTTANLGSALASRGYDVCLVDLDPQSQLTLHLGVEIEDSAPSLYDVLRGDADIASATVSAGEHLWVVPSVVDLAAAETELVTAVGREQVLRDCLAQPARHYEYRIIDCPPSLGLLTLNALAAADELLIPLQAHFLALQGLGRLLETVALVQQRVNPRLRVGGVLLCMFERNTRLANEVMSDLKDFFAAARNGATPWSNAQIFETVIRRNVKLAECPSYGKSIFEYDVSSNGAQDYDALAEEFLATFPPSAPPASASAGPAPRVVGADVKDPSPEPPADADAAPEARPPDADAVVAEGVTDSDRP